MPTGFIRVTPDFLIDGQTLIVTGVKDPSGRTVASRVRVAPPERAAEVAFESYRAHHGEHPVREVLVSPALVEARPATFPFAVAARN
ncbi:MAG TPA: hypothetical protein VM889_09935 [Candidatus Thermoplasmatota archaeon]|nr:hypothetical protein [Candidatus Thermoplasmatota archaeon]